MDKQLTPTLWFDKDGILAKYDYSIYEAEAGCTPAWLTRNAHVYRNIDPYPQMAQAFRELYLENRKKPDIRRYNVKILTAVSNSVTLSEHVLDSLYWIQKNITASFQEKDFYAVATPKQEIPVILRQRLTPYDILIDDYNPNLDVWKKAGGTAVKGVNDINSANPDYVSIDIKQPSEDIVEIIHTLIEKIRNNSEKT